MRKRYGNSHSTKNNKEQVIKEPVHVCERKDAKPVQSVKERKICSFHNQQVQIN